MVLQIALTLEPWVELFELFGALSDRLFEAGAA
jgi:hypothetical protein